jgi:hypothetical protein
VTVEVSRDTTPCQSGYPSLMAAGRCAWGGSCSNPGLVMAGVLVVAISFISGLIALLIVAVKVIVKPTD